MEIRKVFRAGNSLVVSLPQEALQQVELSEGSQVTVMVNAEKREIVLRPVTKVNVPQITGDFAKAVEEFLDEYAGVLRELKK